MPARVPSPHAHIATPEQPPSLNAVYLEPWRSRKPFERLRERRFDTPRHCEDISVTAHGVAPL